jgi:hypothetical protein
MDARVIEREDAVGAFARAGQANRHSGAMRSIEPGIQGFPDAQLRD